MNLLLAASRIRREESVADTSEQGSKVRDLYAALLELLNVDCSMDVLSGTSAGGINAVILGLANVQRFDLDGLREHGSTKGPSAICCVIRRTSKPPRCCTATKACFRAFAPVWRNSQVRRRATPPRARTRRVCSSPPRC